MSAPSDLVIAIHGQLLRGRAGGIESNLIALLAALAAREGSGRQIVIGPGGESEWLRPWLGPRQSILPWTPIRYVASGGRPGRHSVWRALRRAVSRHDGGEDRPQVREGRRLTEVLVQMGARAIHFPYQRHFETSLPFIFEPWDLQHRHLPDFFTPEEFALREDIYRAGCEKAALVITASQWTKADLAKQYAVAPRKIAVIPRGPDAVRRRRMTAAECAATLSALRLPERFAFYPAKAWPHKNHIRLFQAVARLRDHGDLRIPVVCAGARVETHWPVLQEIIEELSLQELVLFPGFLDDDQLSAVFSRAECLVFPSLFEGLGIPLLEAMHLGVPILSSRATCLPELAGEAAIYFDAESVESIADALALAWQRPALIAEYRALAAARAAAFDWGRAARQFDACYRVTTDVASPEDRAVVEAITNGRPDRVSVRVDAGAEVQVRP